MRIVIAGGGIIGLCSAWYLQKAGHEIIVLDKNEFQEVYKYYLKRYYLLLGESLFNHIKKGSIEEGKNFFQYHKDSLSGVGLSINPFKVFIFLLIFIYNAILRKVSF